MPDKILLSLCDLTGVASGPWEYAYYSDDPKEEAYTKKTCLFGDFSIPEKRPWDGDINKTRIHYAQPGKDRANFRSKAPVGLWRALYEVNG